jgi:hypothetical protein
LADVYIGGSASGLGGALFARHGCCYGGSKVVVCFVLRFVSEILGIEKVGVFASRYYVGFAYDFLDFVEELGGLASHFSARGDESRAFVGSI